jgi:shikimate kinase
MRDIVSKVISEYEKDLYIPDVKPQKQYILCPVGLIGSGKTTVVTLLCKRLGLVSISSDRVGDIIHEQNLSVDLEVLTEIMNELFRKYLDLGHSVVADSDCANPSTQDMVMAKKETYHLHLIWIHINPPEKFILEVGLSNKPTWLFENKDVAVASYMKRKKLHENLTMPFMYTFDTSLSNIDEQVNDAAKLIEQDLLKP